MPIVPFKLNQDRRHHIPRQTHKVTNWPAYEAGLRQPFRQAEGLIGSIVALLGLALRVPDHTTLSRRSATLVVPRPSRPSVGAHSEAVPMHRLVDSTGLKLCGPGAWRVEK